MARTESLAAIAARSMCPRCDGREPTTAEEAYASCVFCAGDLSETAPVIEHPTARRHASTPHTESA